MDIAHTNWMEWVETGRWLQVREASLPVSPALVDQAMVLAADPDVSVHRIVRLVSKEQVLTTRVLRLANSASNAPVRPITTITDATVRVGTTAVRNTLLAACITSRMEAAAIFSHAGRDLLDHSIGTAYMAELVAPKLDVDPSEALVCGLLHDIGKLAILKLSVEAPGFTGPMPTPEEVAHLIEQRHALVGAQLLRTWRLPDCLREPVLYHHRPELSVLYSAQTLVVYVANRLSHRYGFGCEAGPEYDVLNDPWIGELGFDHRWLAEMDARAPERFAAARAMVA
ncbi:MAG TPA: HDOD domain-containing protein [Vicinamibacterales bacterium]